MQRTGTTMDTNVQFRCKNHKNFSQHQFFITKRTNGIQNAKTPQTANDQNDPHHQTKNDQKKFTK